MGEGSQCITRGEHQAWLFNSDASAGGGQDKSDIDSTMGKLQEIAVGILQVFMALLGKWQCFLKKTG